jgi:hypothetical protein
VRGYLICLGTCVLSLLGSKHVLKVMLIQFNIIRFRIILLAPHTSGPRDVPRCGALSLLQKTPHCRVDRNLALYQARGAHRLQ